MLASDSLVLCTFRCIRKLIMNAIVATRAHKPVQPIMTLSTIDLVIGVRCSDRSQRTVNLSLSLEERNHLRDVLSSKILPESLEHELMFQSVQLDSLSS